MKSVSMTVNGRELTASVEPRTHLADFLREQHLLTGTHLGCEQGVCGACTILIDGEIARSCIAYAVACEGSDVRTIEDFDDDDLMAQLRQAFSAQHALQCGYCTPGMLITARDIVRRLPEADPARIRVELSGNLCRCTGYVGIVKAVGQVIEERRARGLAPPDDTAARPAPARPRVAPSETPAKAATQSTAPVTSAPQRGDAPIADMTTIEQSFVVHHPRDTVWAYFARIDEVATCMPGVTLTGPVEDNRLSGKMTVKLGPITTAFAGEAEVERDEAGYRGVIRGRGRDQGSASSARGEVTYALLEAEDGAATRIELSVAYALTGSLAQFGRSGIVSDLAGRLTAAFAKNLEARLSGDGHTGAARDAAALDAGGMLFSVIGARIRAFFAAIFGRR